MPAGAAPIQPWPGALSAGRRRGLRAVDSGGAGAEPALYVHGLGGSALNWTDLMGLLSQPPPAAGSRATDAGRQARAAGVARRSTCRASGSRRRRRDGDYSLDARAAAVIALIEKRGNWPGPPDRQLPRRCDQHPGRRASAGSGPHPDADLARAAGPAAAAAAVRLALVAVPGVGHWLLNKMLAMPPEQRTDGVDCRAVRGPGQAAARAPGRGIAEVVRRDGLGYSADALLGSARALVAEYAGLDPASLWHDAARVTAPTLRHLRQP